jgi:hypothetical protein
MHRVFDCGLPVRPATQHGFFRGAADRHDAEIEVGGKAAVQAQLFAAIGMAQCQRRKIEEAEIDGFLYLVGIMPDQQHP